MASDFDHTRLGIAPPAADQAAVPRPIGEQAPAGQPARSGRPEWMKATLAGDEVMQRTRLTKISLGMVVPGTRYKILRFLGDGAMGVVYEAEHLDLDRRVALKIVRSEAAASPTIRQHFRDEARAASRIGSDHIIQVFDFAELPDGRLMFAMELLDGRELADEIEHESLPPARCVAILRQICKGLTVAHEANIIHRDIKPENIMLMSERGRPDHVKILDFGIATLQVDGTAVAVDRSGTPDYIAPEIIAGVPYDERVDMYSLGCVAYQMLVGEAPFTGRLTIERLLHAHLSDKPVPIGEARGDQVVPAPLAAVILRCLAKVPGDRYADVKDLEAALCEAQVAAGIQTTWDDLPLPDVEPARREKLLREMPDPSRVAADPRRRWLWSLVVGASLAVGIGGATLVVLARDDSRAEAGHDTQVEELTRAAEAAAARSVFVYPPASDPDRPTAYGIVLEIEALEGDVAQLAASRAKQLREAFADTLVRLGDEYWDKEGGEAFAIDYYAQAVLFDPQNRRASERATLSPGQLAVLQRKAGTGGFSQSELIAVEPLSVLAENDEVARRRKLRAMRKKKRARETDAALQALFPGELTVLDKNDASGKSSAKGTDRPSADEEAFGDVPLAGRQGGKANSGRAPDPKLAAELARHGRDALKAGLPAEAEKLFRRALDANGRNAMALIGLSDLNFDRGKYSKAANYAKKAVRVAPSDADYRIRLGDAYYKVFRYQEAREQYEQAMVLGHPRGRKLLDKVESKLK